MPGVIVPQANVASAVAMLSFCCTIVPRFLTYSTVGQNWNVSQVIFSLEKSYFCAQETRLVKHQSSLVDSLSSKCLVQLHHSQSDQSPRDENQDFLMPNNLMIRKKLHKQCTRSNIAQSRPLTSGGSLGIGITDSGEPSCNQHHLKKNRTVHRDAMHLHLIKICCKRSRKFCECIHINLAEVLQVFLHVLSSVLVPNASAAPGIRAVRKGCNE